MPKYKIYSYNDFTVRRKLEAVTEQPVESKRILNPICQSQERTYGHDPLWGYGEVKPIEAATGQPIEEVPVQSIEAEFQIWGQPTIEQTKADCITVVLTTISNATIPDFCGVRTIFNFWKRTN